MKKVALVLATVAAATVFAPEASAVPAFARQTGMACAACHFQSYPALTGFGKAFKTGGFTMIGSQGKIEGEHGLSIPAELNMAVYMQARYKKTSGTDTASANNANLSTNSGRIDLPDEFSLFFGGRVAENMGSLTELSLTAGTGAGATGVAGFKLPIVTEVGDSKLLVVPFTVGGLGPQYGFDLFATGSTNNGRVIENGVGYSSAMYAGTGTNASGAAVVFANEDFHVNFTPWAQGANVTNAGGTATTLGGRYIRAAYTPTIAGLETGFGVMSYSGNSFDGVKNTDPSTKTDALTIVDAQAQGEIAGMPMGIYASWGSAAATSGTAVNTYNSGTETKSSLGVLADIGVIANTLNVQVGMMMGKTGHKNQDTNEAETDNSVTVGVRYKLHQNAKVAVAYTSFSGSAYDIGGSGGALEGNGAAWGVGTAGAKPGKGNSLLNVILSAAF